MADDTKRDYVSRKREDGAAETRRVILSAAAELLAASADVSMEAVARAANVTRLTVYNQYGSRRGLLEAVFDARAVEGGIKDLLLAIEPADPMAGFDSMVETLCRFWGQDHVIWALQDAASSDIELKQALESRQGRRREVIDALLTRLMDASARRQELGDLIFAIVSLSTVRTLIPDRTPEQVANLLKLTVRAVLSEEGMKAE